MLGEDITVKITTSWTLAIKVKEVLDKVEKAAQQGMVDSVAAIAGDAIKLSPHVTGHNRRSIAYKVGNRGAKRGSPKAGEKPFEEGEPDLQTLEGAVYSTSGYGGYLETGTVYMPAQPYFKPALDKNIKNLPKGIKANLR